MRFATNIPIGKSIFPRILSRIKSWSSWVKWLTVNENTTQDIRLENPLLINSIQFLIVFVPIQLKSLTQNTLLNCLINHCRKIEVFDRDILVQSLLEASPLKALEASIFFLFKAYVTKMRVHKLYSPYYMDTKDEKIQGERERERDKTHAHLKL